MNFVLLSIGRNAIDVLMSSARRLYAPSLPQRVEVVRNKKQRLRNDFLDFLEEKDLVFPAAQASSTGEVFVSCLVNILWYIDGNHHVFNARSYRIPTLFDKFTGYNTPEASKHRKRSTQNMDGLTLQGHSNDLFTSLQGSFWGSGGWKALKGDFEMLATSLSNYAAQCS